MCSTGYCWQILMKIEFPWQFFVQYSNIKFDDNPSSGSSQLFHADCRTDRRTEANRRFSQLCEKRLKIAACFKPSNQVTCWNANFRQSLSKHRTVKTCAGVEKGHSELSVSRSVCLIFRYPEKLIGIRKEAKNLPELGIEGKSSNKSTVTVPTNHCGRTRNMLYYRDTIPTLFCSPLAVRFTSCH